MEIGVDSFAALPPGSDVDGDVTPAPSPAQRVADLLGEVEAADQVGLDHFGIGEHHRADFLDSAPTIILAAAAARTRSIRLTSAVTVLSARRSGAGVPGVRNPRSHLERSRRNHRRARLVHRGARLVRLQARGLRRPVRGEA